MVHLGNGPLADPTGARAASVMRKYAAPDDVLAGDIKSLFDLPKIASNYADRAKTYPIGSKAAAWTSAAHFHDVASLDDEVGQRIKEACRFFRMEPEWERLASKRPVKIAEGIDHWADPTAKKYPIDTPEQVKAAAEYFVRYSALMPAETRKTYAKQMVKAAGRLPDILAPRVLWRMEAEAGLGKANPDWMNEINARIKAARDKAETEVADALVKLADSVPPAIGHPTFSNAGEISALLERIDPLLGIKFGNALEGLVGETPSTAKAKVAKHVKAANGDWYDRADLDRIPDDLCTDLLGCGPVVSRNKKAEVLADPRLGDEMVRMLEDFGVRPVSKSPRRTDWAVC